MFVASMLAQNYCSDYGSALCCLAVGILEKRTLQLHDPADEHRQVHAAEQDDNDMVAGQPHLTYTRSRVAVPSPVEPTLG